MSTSATQTTLKTPFEEFLTDLDEVGWADVISRLLSEIHEVDQAATQIWFAFYPLPLFREFEVSADPEALLRDLLMQGNYYLKDQIDSSHKFLYGHRFWPGVKQAVSERIDKWQPAAVAGESAAPALAEQVRDVAQRLAAQLKVDASLLVGITLVAFMTVRQAGLVAFRATPGEVLLDNKHRKKSPAQILKERRKDDSQGLLGFLKTVDKKWTVTFDENDDSAHYKMNNMQDLAWGAAEDHTRDWRALDPRRPEGPIPVECRSAACGTCWVGILGGAEKLAEVGAREGTRIKEFGYLDTTEPRPLIRLACQTQVQGAVSIVIPPWNGFFGKYLKAKKQEAAGGAVAAPTILRGRIQK